MTSIRRWSDMARYAAQTNAMHGALSTAHHAIDALIAGLRASGEGSMYLTGSRLDHDFCLGSTDVGTLLSVLPEDGLKAAEPGYHPGSTEVYVTFQGRLTLELLVEAGVSEHSLDQYDVAVIPAGQCHRVQLAPTRQAASLIVKTNLGHEPSVVRCGSCTYFPDPAACALHRRWTAEGTPVAL